ncbi:MAG: DUF2769 domain-containing protein [Deltaproteobacteria bacterium]|nr:DUF2769 domain-containing protein [Deltaproteobacteria bacterium]
MEKSDQRVPFTVENINKCICIDCPVQNTSQCVKEKMKKAKELMENMEGGLISKPEDIPGLYCAPGVAKCKDINTTQMCICGDCPLWEKYNLESGKPFGYYCRDGKAKQ